MRPMPPARPAQAPSVALGRAQGGPSRLGRSQRRAGLLLVAPAGVVLVLVTLVPVAYGFYLSLTSYNPVKRGGPQFHGLDGYVSILTSGPFWQAVKVTVFYAAGTLALTLPAALGLALLVNGRFPGVAVFRAVMYLPRVVPLIAVAMVWLWLYSKDGLFNWLLDLVGIGPVPFLTEPATALPALMVMRAWKALGGSMIIFLAGLQSVPRDLLEAASVDGCGRWGRFANVTLPSLAPITSYIVVVDLIYLSQSFSEVFVMTAGGPLRSTTVVNMLVYKEAFENYRIGQASAMAFCLFALIFGLVVLNFRRVLGEGGRR
ncbi:MAG: sugar ABC transporter permease [Propionibacteriaceae bacterium]|jgi:ABC-type sugar transport system permease subunit|nr:sugar ABC transporter permease [Propionibacteriaceae bacterium]